MWGIWKEQGKETVPFSRGTGVLQVDTAIATTMRATRLLSTFTLNVDTDAVFLVSLFVIFELLFSLRTDEMLRALLAVVDLMRYQVYSVMVSLGSSSV